VYVFNGVGVGGTGVGVSVGAGVGVGVGIAVGVGVGTAVAVGTGLGISVGGGGTCAGCFTASANTLSRDTWAVALDVVKSTVVGRVSQAPPW
jgi:hypothetical protein